VRGGERDIQIVERLGWCGRSWLGVVVVVRQDRYFAAEYLG